MLMLGFFGGQVDAQSACSAGAPVQSLGQEDLSLYLHFLYFVLSSLHPMCIIVKGRQNQNIHEILLKPTISGSIGYYLMNNLDGL